MAALPALSPVTLLPYKHSRSGAIMEQLTLTMRSFLKWLSASCHVAPFCTTSYAPAALSFAIMRGFVLMGTTTVHGSPNVRDAWTAASPALPPLDEKMCGCAPLLAGISSRRRRM